jgi:hypothetical protein
MGTKLRARWHLQVGQVGVGMGDRHLTVTRRIPTGKRPNLAAVHFER